MEFIDLSDKVRFHKHQASFAMVRQYSLSLQHTMPSSSNMVITVIHIVSGSKDRLVSCLVRTRDVGVNVLLVHYVLHFLLYNVQESVFALSTLFPPCILSAILSH
uniref:Uncharacterized protein n=1 Tax=Cacopsylla melanoneura TaxID=428564 RepID=A0A8D8PQP8_9HEMI